MVLEGSPSQVTAWCLSAAGYSGADWEPDLINREAPLPGGQVVSRVCKSALEGDFGGKVAHLK